MPVGRDLPLAHRDFAPGIVPINVKIRGKARNRKVAINRNLENADEFYSREKVRDALLYWNIAL